MICFLQFFFVKCSNNYFVVKITNNIYPRNSFLNFFNHKNFFRPISKITFCKNVLKFWYSYMITNFKFRIFLIIFFIKVNICALLYINRLMYYDICYCIFSLYHLIYQYTYFMILKSYICKTFLHYVLNTFLCHYHCHYHDFIDLFWNSLPLSTNISFWLAIRFI